MIRFYRSRVVDDTPQNGGVPNYDAQVIGNALDNIFPKLTVEERATGLTRYRKIFAHYVIQSPADYRNVLAFNKVQPNNDNIVYIAEGGLVEAQGNLGGKKWHGSGVLVQPLTGGESDEVEVVVREEGGFHDGDIIFVGELSGDGVTSPHFELLTAGSAEYDAGASSYTLSNLTNIAGGEVVRQSFLDPENTMVASCVDIGDLTAEAYDVVNPSAGGLLNLPIVNNIGTIGTEWTIEFLDDDGHVGVSRTAQIEDPYEFNIDEDIFIPNHRTGQNFFYIPASYWFDTGELKEGMVVTFKTTAALSAIWLKLKVEEDCPPSQGVYGVLAVVGE